MDNSFAYQPATERYERMQYKYLLLSAKTQKGINIPPEAL